MRALIIGGGESLRDFDFPDLRTLDATIIGVNGVVDYLTYRGYWFTLDPGGLNIERLERLPEGVEPVMAVPEWFKRGAYPNVRYFDRVEGTSFGWVRAAEGLSDDPGKIHTGNSFYGALGFAKHLGAKRTALLGLDAKGDSHWYDPSELCGPMDHLPALFETIDEPEMEIVNGSPESRVTCFPRMPPEKALEWLMSSPAS